MAATAVAPAAPISVPPAALQKTKSKTFKYVDSTWMAHYDARLSVQDLMQNMLDELVFAVRRRHPQRGDQARVPIEVSEESFVSNEHSSVIKRWDFTDPFDKKTPHTVLATVELTRNERVCVQCASEASPTHAQCTRLVLFNVGACLPEDAWNLISHKKGGAHSQGCYGQGMKAAHNGLHRAGAVTSAMDSRYKYVIKHANAKDGRKWLDVKRWRIDQLKGYSPAQARINGLRVEINHLAPDAFQPSDYLFLDPRYKNRDARNHDFLLLEPEFKNSHYNHGIRVQNVLPNLTFCGFNECGTVASDRKRENNTRDLNHRLATTILWESTCNSAVLELMWSALKAPVGNGYAMEVDCLRYVNMATNNATVKQAATLFLQRFHREYDTPDRVARPVTNEIDCDSVEYTLYQRPVLVSELLFRLLSASREFKTIEQELAEISTAFAPLFDKERTVPVREDFKFADALTCFAKAIAEHNVMTTPEGWPIDLIWVAVAQAPYNKRPALLVRSEARKKMYVVINDTLLDGYLPNLCAHGPDCQCLMLSVLRDVAMAATNSKRSQDLFLKLTVSYMYHLLKKVCSPPAPAALAPAAAPAPVPPTVVLDSADEAFDDGEAATRNKKRKRVQSEYPLLRIAALTEDEEYKLNKYVRKRWLRPDTTLEKVEGTYARIYTAVDGVSRANIEVIADQVWGDRSYYVENARMSMYIGSAHLLDGSDDSGATDTE